MRDFLSKQLPVQVGSRRWSAPLWALLLAMAVIALFCRLGIWQLGRAEEKAVMTARYEARQHMAALELPELLARGRDIEDVPVRLHGRYDNDRLVYLDNQPYQGKAGFHVYAVFFPEGETRGILVNRGWVEVAADMQKLPVVTPAQAREVRGTVAFPSPYFTVGQPDYGKKPLRVARLEMDQLSRALGVELRPFIVRLDAHEPDGFVRNWTPAARLGMPPEQHRAYAFQWFSLAAAVLVVLIVTNLRKSEKPGNE